MMSACSVVDSQNVPTALSSLFTVCVTCAGVVHWLIYVVVHMSVTLARSKQCKSPKLAC